MITKFHPKANEVYFINQYTLFQILEGQGSIEVDFKQYRDWEDKIIFLDKGQYIRFSTDTFAVRKIEFSDEAVFRNPEVRVLFKHLISLGYINFHACRDCQKYLDGHVLIDQMPKIIDVSSEQWYWQNPFQASRDEYHLIFDVKDVIDTQFHQRLSHHQLAELIQHRGYHAQALFQEKIGWSVQKMLNHKRLTEGKKQIAFTDKSVQEIGYDVGFSDPSYFNRVFRQQTGQSPGQFRKHFDFDGRDRFLQDLYELLHAHHQSERRLDFYADQMNLSVKSLSHKVRQRLNLSLGQLIRQELVQTAKELLLADWPVQEIALKLGFEEANHFSTFFKHHTSLSPTQFKEKNSH
ncbi:MAG: AraC family transcriptional regulator [Bacteroidota bacterium]